MTAKRCKATTTTGAPCQAWAGNGSEYCFTHDPAQAERRAQARKLGGYNRRAAHGGANPAGLPGQVRSMADVLTVLDYTLQECLALENSIARTRALISLATGYIEAIKTGEFEKRLEALEGRVYDNAR
jgi:hypothetical protein